ncbi:hypothetical protein M3P36_09265 [Altererythrobacter sp. KTW20L]|uniref:CC0125/CC1285 family lipoprotein n=1 Tax=Altererythrobacter sp. KTW20L TaxID=2942210 RepID=UPI0020BF21A7|nr:hypothetical protein [Altererythrobacter sp. KTW20L]MCL6251227.1 hypothetical protein [Altererythrobacter sp. KTW20L]
MAVVGCAHPTPYQPLGSRSEGSGGYSDERVAQGHYRVAFRGNSLTSRETVEAYLLYRAAELMVSEGYDWFVVIDREVEHTVTREVRRDPLYRPWFGPAYSTWQPYWRYYLRGQGWVVWDPYHADPFWADRVDERRVEQFESSAEIRAGRGVAPAGNGQVFVARDVLEEIGPRVVRPSHG